MTGVSAKVNHGVNLAMADISSWLLSVVQTSQPVPASANETTHSVTSTVVQPSHFRKIVKRSLMSSRLALPAGPTGLRGGRAWRPDRSVFTAPRLEALDEALQRPLYVEPNPLSRCGERQAASSIMADRTRRRE